MKDMIEYIETIVEPTIKDFEEHPTSRRHAFLACVAAFHSIDYLAYPTERPSQLRQEWRKQSPHFKIVDEVAHVFKHVTTGNRAKPDLHFKEVISRPPAMAGVAQCGISQCVDATGGVTLFNDRSIDLLHPLRETVRFLRSLREVPTALPLRRTTIPRAAKQQ
jgi:hypothetical protein